MLDGDLRYLHARSRNDRFAATHPFFAGDVRVSGFLFARIGSAHRWITSLLRLVLEAAEGFNLRLEAVEIGHDTFCDSLAAEREKARIICRSK